MENQWTSPCLIVILAIISIYILTINWPFSIANEENDQRLPKIFRCATDEGEAPWSRAWTSGSSTMRNAGRDRSPGPGSGALGCWHSKQISWWGRCEFLNLGSLMGFSRFYTVVNVVYSNFEGMSWYGPHYWTHVMPFWWETWGFKAVLFQVEKDCRL